MIYLSIGIFFYWLFGSIYMILDASEWGPVTLLDALICCTLHWTIGPIVFIVNWLDSIEIL